MLFKGAGGLSTGLDMSGFVETRAAVEFSPSAAKTFALVLSRLFLRTYPLMYAAG